MSETNPNSRLEAFCDGVFAIALTLLIIDIKIPSTEKINTTADFWLALKHILPSVLAFVLSFVIILITWVNHHNALKLVNRSSAPFIYSNGFMLLTVVFIPFPTALMGEYILTDHAAPAVILYDSTLAIQAISWILVTGSALKDHLCKNEKSILQTRANGKFGYFAFALYSLCAILAIWFPLSIAIITIITWIFWLIWGIRIKHE
jgi:TMEM175 potassium channel family protein